MTHDLPFDGITVVDLSQGIAGPFATMMLAQYGATVIKVEPPGGDWLRASAQIPGGNTGVTVSGNMGKRSICIDLKTDRGADVLWRLVKDASVFVESYRPGVIARLGFSYEAVAQVNPDIVYASVSGFGQSGMHAHRPAMDPVLQAFAGLMSEHGTFLDGPHRLITIPVDLTAALFAFSALSVALYGKRINATGTYLDLSLLQAAAWLDLHALHERLLHDGSLAPQPPIYGNYRTRDGAIFVAVLNNAEWARFRDALDDERLTADRFTAYTALRAPEPHSGDAADLRAIVADLLIAGTTEDWVTRFNSCRIMCAPINDSLTFLRDPHVAQMGLFNQLTQPGIGAAIPIPDLPGPVPFREGSRRSVSPLAGADATEILTEYGFSPEDIHDLRTAGVVSAVDGERGPEVAANPAPTVD